MVRMSAESVLSELAMYDYMDTDISNVLEAGDQLLDNISLEKPEYNKVTQRLKLEVLDVEQYVKKNKLKCVSDPRAFDAGGIESPEGLLSNEIFGYTSKEKQGTFAYIDLHGWFMDPSCYKTWTRLDTKIKNVVHGVKYYTIDENGDLVEDEENGETGIDWLRKNMNKIRFKPTESKSKKLSIRYLEENKDKMWISKYMVIPKFYRDKNTSSRSRQVVGLNSINKLYTNLIVASNALTASQEYGFDSSDSMKARVQDIILQIYDWFCGNTNKGIAKEDGGQGLSGKIGIIRMTNTSKTSDYSSRLVISAYDNKVNRPEDMMVNYDYSAIPLYSAMTQFRDFVLYQTREFFENEFSGVTSYPVIDKNGKEKSVVPDAPDIVFSDERIIKEMDRFLHGYNNRFAPIEVPVEGTNQKYYMKYKGRYRSVNNPDENSSLVNRRLTWCDVFFIATVEACKDKQVLITRFPVDYFSNQFTTKVVVSSTKETEEVFYEGVQYKWYPKIREEDIETDTSNKFVDTLRFSNTYLASIGGDFDGDQCTCKGVYTREANAELDNYMNSKQNFVTFGAKALKEPGSDSIQSMYALTKILSTVKVTPSEKIMYK